MCHLLTSHLNISDISENKGLIFWAIILAEMALAQKKKRVPITTLPTDFRHSGLWATKVSFYMLWFEYLALSPSYELARQYRAGKLSAKDEESLPVDFDLVLATYDDFGDVQRKSFLPWWRERGMSLCAFQGAKPRVSTVAALKHSPSKAPDPIPNIHNYVDEKWVSEGSQNTILVAIPIGLPKARIASQISDILDKYPKPVKQIKSQPSKYSLSGKRQNKDMLFRYMHVLRGRAAMPSHALWRVGVRTGVSDTYSPELDYNAKTVPNEDTYDRMMLTILTSRAYSRGKLIAENAARGVFPSYAPCPTAVEPDLGEVHKRIASRHRWQKKQRAG